MEKFMQNAFPTTTGTEYSPRGSSEVDLDFNDVFGGPPRRFSMQEVRIRYSFGETASPATEAVEEGSDEGRESPPWSLLKEKPVFGEETSTVVRRRRQGADFFDDIFRGGAATVESPRRGDRSNPGSRIMSPSRPLPSPRADPFGTSLPAPFSLPAKMTKAMELPTFTSRDYKTDGSPKGLTSSHSSSSLSRFSNQPIWGQDENIRNNEFHPVYRHSPLSRHDSLNGEDSPPTFSSDQKDNYEKNFKRETVTEDSYGNDNNNQFHFSIYKWAGKGVPMLMPFVTGNISKSKDNAKFDKCASSNGRMESKLPTVEKEVYIATRTEPTRIEDVRSREQIKRVKDYVEEAKAGSKSPNDSVEVYKAKQNVKEIDIGSDTREKNEPMKIKDSLRDEVKKPLHAYLGAEVEVQGNVTEAKVKKTKTTKGVRAKAHDSKNVKKSEGVRNDSTNATVEKSNLQDEAINSRTTTGKSSVRGKVRDFVQIFNQEVDSGTQADAQSRSQSCRWPADQKENELSSNEAKAKEKDKIMHNADKTSLKVDENLKNDEARKYSPPKASDYTSNRSTDVKKPFTSETLHKDPNMSVENSDDPFLDNFSVLELSEDHEKVTQNENSEDMKAIDAKVQQWSAGKKGNIHSLLSTLQLILWPDSGWKPVPLVDLIEANSVKRAYQKALLRLHPDKLQQKGAAFHQKYTAEKVFDILQEAWDHFNTSSTFAM